MLTFLMGIGPAFAGPQIYLRPGVGDPNRPDRDLLPNQLAMAYEMAFAGLQRNVTRLGKTKLGQDADAMGPLTSIQTNAAFLLVRWKDWLKQNGDYGPSRVSSDLYLRSLERDSDLLRQAAKEKDRLRALGLLEDAALDLSIKAANCRLSEDGLGRVIRVKVRTVKNRLEVNGYEVWYVQKGLLDVPSAHDRFRRQSSPTDERELWPGGYAMWIKRGETNGPPTTVRMGGEGQNEIVVDLEVP